MARRVMFLYVGRKLGKIKEKNVKDQIECPVFFLLLYVLRILVKIILDEKCISLRVHSHLFFIRRNLIVEQWVVL